MPALPCRVVAVFRFLDDKNVVHDRLPQLINVHPISNGCPFFVGSGWTTQDPVSCLACLAAPLEVK